MQAKQPEWHEQWSLLQDNELFLFQDWIAPFSLETFQGQDVLECGCGGGQHTNFIAPYAKSVTAVDLNTIDLAKTRNQHHTNVKFVEADLVTMDLGETFDIVLSIGVIHHTDNPEQTVINLKRHLKTGGLFLLWVYSEEGNWLVRRIVEPVRQQFLSKLTRPHLLALSKILTALLYLPVYSVYFLPLSGLPYYEYFQNFRKLSFSRNTLNVFDKLNAPQVDFISKARAEKFICDLDDGQVLPYKGVSWRISGRKHE